jgi:hypothetical protein
MARTRGAKEAPKKVRMIELGSRRKGTSCQHGGAEASRKMEKKKNTMPTVPRAPVVWMAASITLFGGVAGGCGSQAPGQEAPGGPGGSDGSTRGGVDGSTSGDDSNGPEASIATDGSGPGMPGTDSPGPGPDDTGTSSPDAGSDATIGTSGFAIVTNRYDNLRNGANTSETTLTVATVGGSKFGKVAAHPVDGHLYAQPLYLPGVVLPSGTHNIVFAATEHDTVYAFDADATVAPATDPLWTRSLGTPMDTIVSTNGYHKPFSPGSTVTCADMFPKTGITSTPVIDRATGRLYVVGKFLEGGVYSYRLYALDVKSGMDAVPPVVIQGSVAGTGIESDGGTVAFDAQHSLNRPGLLLTAGHVFLAFGSHCDDPPYHGWVFAYTADTLTQKGIFNTTPNGKDGAIWQTGMGLVGDQNDIYFSSGNGDFDPSNKGAMVGVSVVHLQFSPTAGLTLKDWFTPFNAAALNAGDQDLTSAPILLPNPRVLVAGGKNGHFFVLDPANMGKFNPVSNTVIQDFSPGVGHIHGPVYWNGPSGPTLYAWAEASPLRAFRFTGNQINTTPVSQFTGDHPTHPGGVISVSSNGTMPGTGILWATFTSTTIDPVGKGDAWHHLVPGVLYAFDAADLTTPIWKSVTNATRDDIGIFAKHNPPVVANGKVYLATQGIPDGGKLLVYGLLP